jgi:MinD-like ATPase involved in chromosome partitioning or flagellar assembly
MKPHSRGALVDGLPARQGALARARRRAQRLTVSRAEIEEAHLEARLLAHRGVTRANVVAFMSPAGGVGKTTCAFAASSILASHLKLRTIAVDVGPGSGSGTLAHFVPERRRAERGIEELLADADRLLTAAALGPYVSKTSTGLHVLAGRHEHGLDPDQCAELLALLSCFYEAIVLDLGAGVTGPMPTLAANRADQIVLVTTPDRMASAGTLHARAHLRHPERITVAINRSDRDASGEDRPYRAVAIPEDHQLAAMLASRTYSLGAASHPTRTAIKRLGLAVAEQLV